MPQMGPLSWMIFSLSLVMGAITLSYSLSTHLMVCIKPGRLSMSPLPSKLILKW